MAFFMNDLLFNIELELNVICRKWVNQQKERKRKGFFKRKNEDKKKIPIQYTFSFIDFLKPLFKMTAMDRTGKCLNTMPSHR